jgi:hypothetical protein
VVLGGRLLVHGDEPPEHGAQLLMLGLRLGLGAQQVAAGSRRDQRAVAPVRRGRSSRRRAGPERGRGRGVVGRVARGCARLLHPLSLCRRRPSMECAVERSGGDWGAERPAAFEIQMPFHARNEVHSPWPLPDSFFLFGKGCHCHRHPNARASTTPSMAFFFGQAECMDGISEPGFF